MDMSFLVSEIKKPSAGLRLRQGKVTAVNAGQSIDVEIAGDTNALPSVKYLDSFIPVVNAGVWLLNLGADLLAIGNVGTDGGAPTIASATTIAPTTRIVFISGTTAIATITAPPWLGAGGTIILIPTGVFTTTTAGNIALASTAVVNKALTMVYDSVTAKFYPSY